MLEYKSIINDHLELHYTQIQRISYLIIIKHGQIGYTVGIVSYSDFISWLSTDKKKRNIYNKMSYTGIKSFVPSEDEFTIQDVKAWIAKNLDLSLGFWRWE